MKKNTLWLIIFLVIIVTLFGYFYFSRMKPLFEPPSNPIICGAANPDNACSGGVCADGYTCTSFDFYCGCVKEDYQCGAAFGCSGTCVEGEICTFEYLNSTFALCNCNPVSDTDCYSSGPACTGKCKPGMRCQSYGSCYCAPDPAQACSAMNQESCSMGYCSSGQSCEYNSNRQKCECGPIEPVPVTPTKPQ